MAFKAGETFRGDRLSDFTRDKRILLLSLMALLIGALSAVAAYVLVQGIKLATNLSFYQSFSFADTTPMGNRLGLLVIGVPVMGGLLIGLLARFGSEKIRGHGIPEALEAILIGRSRMSLKVAVLKPVSSIISIGTGGPFGAEGPIIMTGGALGSLFAQLFHLSASERKTLLVAGAAGGMAAIFATPVAAILLAVELLLFEWRPRSFIPVAIAASAAALLRVPLMGAGPIFPVALHGSLGAGVVGTAFVLGIVAGVGSFLLSWLVYVWEDFFHKLPVHWMWWPLLGGLAVGVGGWLDPRVLGVGYGSIHGLLRGQDLGGLLILLLAVKALVWSIALGSGTSGGILAPLLILGGTLGALESHFLSLQDPGLWALIGMAAMMGGMMRSPLTAMIFALELTRDIATLPALLAGCLAAHAFTVLFMRRSILTEKLARRGHHLNREYSVDPLQLVRVEDIMDREVASVPQDMKVQDLFRKIEGGDPFFTRHQAFPIVDGSQRLVGIITRKDALRALRSLPDGPQKTVREAGSGHLAVAWPDDLLNDALNKMLRRKVGRLLVVSREAPDTLLGYVGRASILSAGLKRHQEEHVREPGWLSPSRRRKIALRRLLSGRGR